jgi:citrate lyase subunit beta/citryl-CoA lyase
MSAVLDGPALLFCPGDRPDRFVKAAERSDTVILDLEDAVGPDSKAAARAHVEAALPTLDGRAVVRVNGPRTPWYHDDLAAVRRAGARRVMLSKAEDPCALRELSGLEVIALCETAAGILAARDLAAEPNCAALFWGGEDLIADLGGHSSRDGSGRYRPVVEHARATVLLAAAEARIPAIDAVHLDIADLDGLRAETEDAVNTGFAAKACIHPAQAPVVREVFRPTGEEVAWARAVTAAADTHRGGVFTHAGHMVDGPVVAHALRILDRHDAVR